MPDFDFEGTDDRDAYVQRGTPERDEAQIEELKRALSEDALNLVEGEQLCLTFGERQMIIERIGENVLAMVDWPRWGRDLHDLLDLVIAMGDPAMQLFVYRGRTFIASVRRAPNVEDVDRFWAVVHA